MHRKGPCEWTPWGLYEWLNVDFLMNPQGGYKSSPPPDRKYNFAWRFHLAWKVFTGRADVLDWRDYLPVVRRY